MVAILSPGKSIRNSFYYNENKVKAGVARLLHTENYPSSKASLSEPARLDMLLKMAGQNTRTKVNSLHITLNFDPSEKLSEDRLKEITRDYMAKIGFANQPYLIYQHFDAGHPHVHVVTTNVEATGKLISLHHLGILKSEPARKELEQRYGLIQAQGQKNSTDKLKTAYSSKIIYGRTDSRRAIANVLHAVLDDYKYTSLPELNALLSQYNVLADKGTEQSRIYKNNGLVYRILDEHGNPVGVPIKASSFYNKPTLRALEERFLRNEDKKKQYRNQARNTIDTTITKEHPATLTDLKAILMTKGIGLVPRENKDGVVYGITYVDHNTHCVFNGSELGKNYSAKEMMERLNAPFSVQKTIYIDTDTIVTAPALKTKSSDHTHDLQHPWIPVSDKTLMEELMQSEGNKDFAPFELRGKKKKRKKHKSI